MNKTLLALALTLMTLSTPTAHADADRLVLRCTPTAAETNRSGLERVVLYSHFSSCDQHVTPNCKWISRSYVAEVTVAAPHHHTVSQTYSVNLESGPIVPGRGAVYRGFDFRLALGPVAPNQSAFLDAILRAHGDHPAQDIRAEVACH